MAPGAGVPSREVPSQICAALGQKEPFFAQNSPSKDSNPQSPTFCGFEASESPNETRRPPYQWSLGAAGGPASPRTVGANGGSTRVPGAKKMLFSKVVPRPLGMLKQVVLAILSPWGRFLAPGKSQNALKMGHFGTKNGSKMGQKRVFPKVIPGTIWDAQTSVFSPF